MAEWLFGFPIPRKLGGFSSIFKPREEFVHHHRPAIIPPTSFKNLETDTVRQTFGGLWSLAYSRLNHADRIVIIGCSISPTDVHLRLMLRDAVLRSRATSPPTIVYIGGDNIGENISSLFNEKVRPIPLAKTLGEWYKDNLQEE